MTLDPTAIYTSPSNKGLATPLIGLARPALGVYAQQQQEDKLRKQQEEAAKQKAVEDNDKFGEELLKDKFNSLDTQRNEHKNTLLKGIRETYNQANLQYSVQGKSIPMEVRQDLERKKQEFVDNWEQIETAYNYTQGIIKSAETDKSGAFNVENLKKIVTDLPTTEEGKIVFSKYNEKYVEQKIKENALEVLNAPKVAENFMGTVAKTKLAKVNSLGNGQHDEKTEAAKDLMVFKDKFGRDTFTNPETGLPQLDDSPEALALARQDEQMNMLIEAKVAKGEADTPAEAYRQLITNQAKVESTVNRQGSVKDDDGGSGYSVPEPKVSTRFDTIHRALTNYDTDALAQMFDLGGNVNVQFKGNEYGPGESIPDRIVVTKKEKYNPGRHIGLTAKDGYILVKEVIDISSDKTRIREKLILRSIK